MLGKTHLLTSVAFGLVAVNYGYIDPTLVNVGVIAVASVIPDIDKKGTTASRKVLLPFH